MGGKGSGRKKKETIKDFKPTKKEDKVLKVSRIRCSSGVRFESKRKGRMCDIAQEEIWG